MSKHNKIRLGTLNCLTSHRITKYEYNNSILLVQEKKNTIWIHMGYSRVSKHFHLYDWFDSYTHTYSYSHSRYHVFTHIEQPAWKLLLKTICLLLMKKIHIPVEIMNVWQAHIWSILQFDYVSDFFFVSFLPEAMSHRLLNRAYM